MHLYDKPVFVATDVEHHAIIAANTGTGVEQLDLTRAKPNRFTRFFIPTVKRPSSIGTPGFFPKLFEAVFGDYPHSGKGSPNPGEMAILELCVVARRFAVKFA